MAGPRPWPDPVPAAQVKRITVRQMLHCYHKVVEPVPGWLVV